MEGQSPGDLTIYGVDVIDADGPSVWAGGRGHAGQVIAKPGGASRVWGWLLGPCRAAQQHAAATQSTYLKAGPILIRLESHPLARN
jgi:hypothetical protein